MCEKSLIWSAERDVILNMNDHRSYVNVQLHVHNLIKQ